MILRALLMFLVLIPAASLVAQEKEGAADKQDGAAAKKEAKKDEKKEEAPKPIDSALVAISHFTPKRADVNELNAVVSRMAGRTLYVIADGVISRAPNLSTLGNSIVVYDTKEASARIHEALNRLDEISGGTGPSAPLFSEEIVPKFIGLQDLSGALNSYMRRVSVTDPNGRRDEFQNISLLQQRGVVVVRDTQENLIEIKRLVARLDVAVPQVLVTCHLVQGSKEEKSATGLSPDLVDNLMKLVPYRSFELLGTGMIRTAAKGDRPVELSMNVNDTTDCRMQIRPSGWNPDEQVLILDDIGMTIDRMPTAGGGPARRQTFQTRTNLKAGEFTVVGAFGGQPIFVVLTVTAVR